MLTLSQCQQEQRRRRPPPSLKQQYQEYILQRIEGYKNSIPRDELLRLGDEAVSELATAAEEQFLLTEVLMLESVDRLIMKRLSLRSYRRWRQQFLKLREAQRQPTHWGWEPGCPIVELLPRIEAQDIALVVGAGIEPIAYLLAAHDACVTFIAGDLGCVERAEARVASESLASLFEGYVVQLGTWLPELDAPAQLVVIDAGALAGLPSDVQRDVVHDLQARTAPGGLHVLLAATPGLAPEALLPFYEGWVEERPRARRPAGRTRGLVLCAAIP